MSGKGSKRNQLRNAIGEGCNHAQSAKETLSRAHGIARGARRQTLEAAWARAEQVRAECSLLLDEMDREDERRGEIPF